MDTCMASDQNSAEPSAQDLQDILSRGLPSLYRRAYRLLGNAADAEDAVQDAMFAAYKHLNQFRGHSQISTWLHAIVANCARTQLRKRPRHPHISLDSHFGEEQEYSLAEILEDCRPTPEEACRNSELKVRLKKHVAKLSPTLRRTFHLRHLDNLSIDETARVLGVPIGTVNAQLARARAKLRHSLRRTHQPLPRASQTARRREA
jgi:RNA polymerase sigma factor (sigma-70 family)